MKLTDLIDAMNALAPQETALSFDNCGLLIGTERKDLRRVLVALDATLDVVEEAEELGCDLVLVHHPLIFSGLKRILPDAPDGAAVYRLIRSGIALFAAHTNLDAAEGGVNTALCRALGIEHELAVPPENIMRIGELPSPMPLSDFARRVEAALGTTALIAGEDRLVRRVAVMGGSGGGDCALAKEHGADCYVTGECKHSQAIEAGVMGLAVIAAGHHETESVVLAPLIDYLRANTSGAEYVLSRKNKPVFRPLRKGEGM